MTMDLETTLLAAQGFDVPWAREASQAVQSVPVPPKWRVLGWPSQQAWEAVGSPEQEYSDYLQQQAATAQSLVAGASAAPSSEVAPAALQPPPAHVEAAAGVPGTITPEQPYSVPQNPDFTGSLRNNNPSLITDEATTSPYVDPSARGTLRGQLEAERQGQSQFGTIPERIAENPVETAALLAAPIVGPEVVGTNLPLVGNVGNVLGGFALSGAGSRTVEPALEEAGVPTEVARVAGQAPAVALGPGSLLTKGASLAGMGALGEASKQAGLGRTSGEVVGTLAGPAGVTGVRNLLRGEGSSVLRAVGSEGDEAARAAGLGDEAAQALPQEGVVPEPVAASSGSAAGGASPSPSAATATAEQTPVQKLTSIVDQARELPAENEAVYRAERSRRAGAYQSILEQGGYTPEAFAKARGVLGGDLGRAAFEAPSTQLTPDDISAIYKQLGEARLRPYETRTADRALSKVFEGHLNMLQRNEIALLDKVFGSDLSMALAEKTAPKGFRGILDKLRVYWMANVLSGPITHAKNFVGNLSAVVVSGPQRGISGALEGGLSRIQGRQAERFWQEGPASVIGALHGVPEGLGAFLRVMREGLSPSEATRVENASQALGGSTVGRLLRAPLTLLEASDQFFHSINDSASLSALAVRNARKEGLTGDALTNRIAELMAEPTEEMIEEASKLSEYHLFRDDPTRFGRAALNAKKDIPALDFVIPFAKTPDRLIAYGIRHSPWGLFDIPMWSRLLKGNPEAVDELSRTLIGSGVMFGLASMVAAGTLDITAGAPISSAARDRFYREGRQPFSVNIPGVGWVQYSQIPVLNVTLTTLAAAKEAHDKGGSIDQQVLQAVSTVGQNVLDQSYLSGLSDFIDAVQAPELGNAERFAGRWVTGLVPASGALRQANGVFDRTVRSPQGVLENIKSGIPGLAQTVPERVTAFGETARFGSPQSPIQFSPDRQSAVDAELERTKVEVTFVGRSVAGIDLSRSQQSDYQRAAGQVTYQMLDAIIQSPSYQSTSDANKAKILEAAKDKARAAVRDVVTRVVDSKQFENLAPENQQAVVDALMKQLAEDPQRLLQQMR